MYLVIVDDSFMSRNRKNENFELGYYDRHCERMWLTLRPVVVLLLGLKRATLMWLSNQSTWQQSSISSFENGIQDTCHYCDSMVIIRMPLLTPGAIVRPWASNKRLRPRQHHLAFVSMCMNMIK